MIRIEGAGQARLLRAALIAAVPPVALLLAAGLTAWQAATATAGAEAAQARLTAALARLPAAGRADAGKLLISGETAGVAGAAFQSLLADVAAMSDATLDRVDPGAAEEAGPLTRLRLTALCSGTEEAVMNLVINLEAAEPLIFIDRLNLVATEGGRLQAELALSAHVAKVGP